MGNGISPRSLQFYNSETVFDLSKKQTTFLGDSVRVESLAAMGFNPDVFRYLTGLARYKTTSEGGGVTIGNIAEFDDQRVTIDGNSIEFEKRFQEQARIPFWKIEFVDNQLVQRVGEDENALLCESFQDIKYYFRSLDWVKIFFSPEVFNEFLELGHFGGTKYGEIPTDSIENERLLMVRCEETIATLMGSSALDTPMRFIKRPPGLDVDLKVASFGASYSDLNINMLAQVPETLIRLEKEKNLETVCDLRFIVDENYNFLSREFEFGPDAPSNRFYTGFEESLMPSSYNFSIIKYLEGLLGDLYRIPTDARASDHAAKITNLSYDIYLLRQKLFFGPFDLEPYAGRDSQVGRLTRDLYNKFGQSIKNLSSDRFELAYGEEEEQRKRRLILIDPMVSQDFNFQSLFPFGNRIEITDLPDLNRSTTQNLLRYLARYNLETDIMLNLMNGTVTPDSDITSTRKTLSVTDYFTGRTTTSRTSRAREFDFVEIFNNSSQPFNIDKDTNVLEVRTATRYLEIRNQLEDFNNEFTTPYLSGLNLNTYDGWEDEGAFAELRLTLRNRSFNSLPDLKEMFLSEKNNYFEIFAYRVVKRNTSTGATQQFFIFNRPEGEPGDPGNSFFDTQVKPYQEYTYTLSALAFVFENNYRYGLPSNIQSDVTLEPTDLPKGGGDESWDPLNREDNRYILGSRIRTRQLPKIIELPLTSENSVLTDAPPARPNVDFYPVKDFNDRVKIRVSSMNTAESAMPVVIESGDFALFTKIRQSQKVNSNEEIKFNSDGYETPAAFEVFRLDRKPETIQDFAGKKRVVRSVTSKDLNTDGTSFMDDIAANVDYYYLFRTLDFHGNISNPTEVFKFTLVDNEGALQPLLATISLEEMFGTLKADGRFRKLKKDTNSKEVRRFIKIRPNPQEISFIPGQFGEEETSEEVSSVLLGRGALPSSEDPDKIESQNNIINQRYMLELKSKKTGKSIFVEFKYVLDNSNIATVEQRTMVPYTVTDKDVRDSIARRLDPDEIVLPTQG